MKNLQEVFNRLQKTKRKQKEIKLAYKDALLTATGYKELIEEIKTLKEKKKRKEQDIKNDFTQEFDKLEELKADSETDQEMLSDIALNNLVKGETVKVVDEAENDYEPVFNVKFKKVY